MMETSYCLPESEVREATEVMGDWGRNGTLLQLMQGASHCSQVRSLPVSTSRKYGLGGLPMFIAT